MAPTLGWRMVLRDRARSAVAALGITVAVVIVFVEMGFMNGVIDSHLRIVDAARGDLVVLDARRSNLTKWDSLPSIRIQQIAAIEGINRVSPVYQAGVSFRSGLTQPDHRIIVIAFSPDDPPIELGWTARTLQALRQPGVVLMDRLSRPIYGDLREGQDVWLEGQRATLAGFVTLGPDMINDGQMVMSESTFSAMHTGSGPKMAVVHLNAGIDVARMQATIREQLGDEVQVFSKEQLSEREAAYFSRVAPVGLLFGAGMAAGLFVGLVICYQVLYVTVRRRLKAYATLKAMGFGNGFVLRTIVQQALLLGIAGYAIGLTIAAAAYAVLARHTGLLIQLTWMRSASVALGCLAACALAGCMAAVRAMRTSPGDLF